MTVSDSDEFPRPQVSAPGARDWSAATPLPGAAFDTGDSPFAVAPPQPRPQSEWNVHLPPPPPRPWLIPLGLFLATCQCVYYVGLRNFRQITTWDEVAGQFQQFALSPAEHQRAALLYAAGVLGILGTHELGHFLQTLRYRMHATFPLFIPVPPPLSLFGTMGAVIFQRGSNSDRKSLFDIAISGPLAGLAVALPVLIYGMLTCQVTPTPNFEGTHEFGEPLLMKGLQRLVRPIPEGYTSWLNPPLFAGWFGLFITALNLLPIGQLDGGHLLHCLLPRTARFWARRFFWLLAATVITAGTYYDQRLFMWVPLLLLLRFMGIEHPPTLDDTVPLGRTRIVLGWLTLAFIIIGITPIPFS
ncbi:MAG: site-2 protease family protein [Planctomycetaceae bacterium]